MKKFFTALSQKATNFYNVFNSRKIDNLHYSPQIILPDYDDIVKITTAHIGGGADVSDKVSMQVQAQILENANTSKYTAVGNVSYKTTNENLQFSDVATQIEVELGTPTITEN